MKNIKGTDLFIGTGVYKSIIDSKLEESKAQIIKFKDRVLMTISIIFILAIIILGLIIFKFSNYITSNLQNILEGMTKLANGNLQAKLEVKSQDELGELSREFNETVEQQSESILQLLDNMEQLSEYSEELSASVQQGDAIIVETNNLIESISASTQEVASIAQESTAQ